MLAPLPHLERMNLAVQLASFLLNPIATLEDQKTSLSPLSGKDIRSLATHKSFKARLNRAVGEALEWFSRPLPPATLDRLGRSPAHRLAFLLVSGERALIERSACMVAGAILHRRFMSVILKKDRLELSRLLGPEASYIALHEASLLYSKLAELDPNIDIFNLQATADGMLSLHLGLSALTRFLEAVEPYFISFFRDRFSLDPSALEWDHRLKVMTQNHVEQTVRLLRRRLETWSAIID